MPTADFNEGGAATVGKKRKKKEKGWLLSQLAQELKTPANKTWYAHNKLYKAAAASVTEHKNKNEHIYKCTKGETIVITNSSPGNDFRSQNQQPSADCRGGSTLGECQRSGCAKLRVEAAEVKPPNLQWGRWGAGRTPGWDAGSKTE